MEQQFKTTMLGNGGVEIPQAITDTLGAKLKSICMNDVWLLLTTLSDNRFAGEPLRHDGTIYFLPEDQLLALEISPGATIRLVSSDVLGTIILQKLSNDSQIDGTKD